MFKFCVVIMFTFLSIQLSAAEKLMYQWRDKNNTLHVSQVPPQNVEYDTIVIGSSQHTAPAVKPQEQPLANNAAQQNCDKAKNNLKILGQDLPVFIDLEDGSKQQLNEAQMEDQRQLAVKQIELFCETTANNG